MNGPRFLMLDFETRSRISVSDASYRKYASDPTTSVLCLGLQWDGRPATVKIPMAGPVFRPGYDQTPIEIQHAVQYGIPIYAQNAVFDRVMYEEHCVKKLGWLPVPTHLWMDLMAIAAYYSLPRNLESMAKALRLRSRKDKEGATALKAVYKPRKPRKAELKEWLAVPGHTVDNMPLLWRDEPERLARIYEYCRVDVETQTEALQLLGPLPPDRLADWRFDQVINARGIPIDFAAVVDCSIRIDASMEHYNRRMAQITANMHHPDGMVKKVTERQKLVDWLQLQGIDTVSLDKAAVEHLLRRPDLPKHVEEVLVMRQEAGRSSLGKIETIIEQTDIDWRTRDTLMYHGAGTGRWTGRGWQPHNLPRECLSVEEAEKFYSCLLTGREFDLPWSLPETVSRAIRSFIAPHTSDRVLYVSDFAAIEARVLAWLAGCDLLLTAFRSGKCVYRQFGSRASGKPEDQIGKKDRERQLGKVSVLGLGYGMGGKDRSVKQKDPVTGEVTTIVQMSKFRETAAAPPYNIDLTPDQSESIVNLYRTTYPEVPRMWAAMEEAFIAAIKYDQVVSWGKFLFGTAVVGHYRFAWIQLPSGRRLWYPEPELEEIKRPYGKTALRATFMGVNPANKQWVRQNTWGGTLTENCLASFTQVMTDTGWKFLSNITLDDFVWDGENWVRHEGLTAPVWRDTVVLGGLHLTADHLVWEKGGWVPAGDLTSEEGPNILVMDLKNAGPNSRFTVWQPESGTTRLVHNCTQAVAADLLINSMKRVEALGFEVILSVHDEVVAEGPVTLDPQVFHKAMVGPLPAWADGLPIECESQIMRRYGKEGTAIK